MIGLRILVLKYLLDVNAGEHLKLLAQLRGNREERDRLLAELEELEQRRARRTAQRTIAAAIARRVPTQLAPGGRLVATSGRSDYLKPATAARRFIAGEDVQ